MPERKEMPDVPLPFSLWQKGFLMVTHIHYYRECYAMKLGKMKRIIVILPNAQKRPYFRFFLFWWVTLPFQQEMRLNQKIEKNNYAMVEINVDKFYSNRAYYPFIPGSIFQALENAYLAGKETALVPEDEYNVMMFNINASLCPGQ